MSSNAYYRHLRSVPLFADLSRRELEVVGQAATDLELPAGRVLITEGSSGHEMFVVTDGTLDVTADGEHLAEIGPGEFVGEMALLTHCPRNATVTATTDVTVIHLDGRAFSRILEEAPQIAVKMLPVVAGRVAGREGRPC